MAPKKPFKVHSLSKHIEDTKKGLSAEAQYNKRPVSKSTASIKREPGTIDKAIFGNNSDDDDSDSSSSGSSDGDGSDFLRKLQGTKTSTSTAPKKPARRDEIADSDNERQPSAKNVTTAKSNRPLQSGASSSDDSSSESDSDSESGAKLRSTNSEQKVRANGAPVKTSSSDSTSSGSEEEGSESSSDDERAEKATATKGKDSTSPDEESSDGASDEESDDESEPATSTQHRPAKIPANGTSTATTTSETSSSDEDSTDDEKETAAKVDSMATATSVPNKSSDDISQDSSEEDADVSMHIADRQHGRQTTVPDFIAPDFVLRKSDDGTNGHDVARICNEANLQGKQVWYFTVPANVPISVVQNMEIPMNQSHRGDGIFSHNGEDYGISMDSMTPKSSIQILIPSADGARYQSAPRPIDQVMQVKKITQLGQGQGSVTTSSVGPTPKPPPRQQPEGLKARYQPFGVNSPMGQIGVDLSFRVENDAEMADASALAIPSSSTHSKSDKKEKKRKSKEKEKGESETPKKGKRKHASSDDDAVAAAEQLREENLSAETKSKKQKTGRDGSPDLGSDAPSSSAVSKKQTLVVPRAIPASTPSKSKSKSKSSKSKPQTPASKPRETAVPVPQVPGSSQPKISPVPVPQPGLTWTPLAGRDDKTSKKRKTKTPDATAKTQQSPPPSAQPAGKTSKTKVTPVPMPKLKTIG